MVKNVYSIIKKAVKQNCGFAVIKNIPMDHGLKGNRENENRTTGLGSIFSTPM